MCWVAWTMLTKPKYAGGLGFKDVETFNDALLAKIGWRLIKDPTSLVAQVLLGKYAKNTSFLDCVPPASASHGWRSILSGKEVLKKGLGWAVGNGENINVWRDPWLSCSFPKAPIGPPTEESALLKVSNLLCPISNTWNHDNIRRYLPQYEEIICGIITSSGPAEDTMVWLPDARGCYSTKTGYGVACASNHNLSLLPLEFDWLKHIWNLKTAPKLKDFLWKIINRAIPVSSNLSSRGVPPFACKRCGGIEDDLHVFVSCPFAENVWEMAPFVWKPGTRIPSLATLLSQGSKLITLPPIGVALPLWPWLLWNLWKSRNKVCFDNRFYTAEEVLNKAITDAREWQSAQADPSCPTLHSPTLQPRATEPPSTELACYSDAAWSTITKRCGIGGIFKGSSSLRIPNISFSRRFISSALMAEAIAVRSAVMTASFVELSIPDGLL